MWRSDQWKDYELIDCGRGEKLERWGGQMPDEVAELAKKAKFSPHTLTEEERTTVVEAARTISAQVDKALPWYKRFCCRYILGLC